MGGVGYETLEALGMSATFYKFKQRCGLVPAERLVLSNPHSSQPSVAGHSNKKKINLDIKLIISGLLMVHLLFAWTTHYFILNSKRLNKRQKSNWLLLNWSIPILWSIIVRIKLKEKKNDVMTKAKRKRSSGNNTDNWMGMTGGGSDSI